MGLISFWGILLGVLLLFFISGSINEKKNLNAYREKRRKEYGNKNTREWKAEEFKHVNGYFKKHAKGFCVDDITWNDLNLDDIFLQMDYAQTSAGDEYLYYLLRCPSAEDMDWDTFEKKTEYFRTQEEDRLCLQMSLHKMGYTGTYSIYDYLDHLDALKNRSSKKDIAGILLLAAAIVLMFFHLGCGIAALFLVVFYNVTTYFKQKAQVDPYITSFRYLFRILDEITVLKKVKIPCIEDEIMELSELRHAFDHFTRFSFLIMSRGRMSGDIMEVGLDYIRIFLHLDILKFNSMCKEAARCRKEIDRMLQLIGRLDAYLSIGEYREYLQEYCIPEYKKSAYSAKGLYHPLLTAPVKNDVHVTKSMLITGSNASGKSTFLKTAALNAILAQSIHTVCADRYEGDLFRVYSSLSLKDNILQGDSYYMAEIKSIKRIVTAMKENERPVLAFVDEVLRGTNTVERISASSVILQQLALENGYCFAATHDLELAEILSKYYENVHFEERIKEGDIVFPYRLQKGKATTKNAIALLKIMGYDDSITQKATECAERFEALQKWEVLS